MIVRWSHTALNDLELLVGYIARENVGAALATADAIRTSVARLEQFPAIGRAGRHPGTRELVIAGAPFITPYSVSDGQVTILAVLHAARRRP